MAEILHAGALAATALSTCCVAAAGRRLRVRDLFLAALMLLAMADIVLSWQLLSPLWWAVALVATSMTVAAMRRDDLSITAEDRSARAMDAVGGVLMAALLVVMAGGHGPAAVAAAPSAHSGHGWGTGSGWGASVVAIIAAGSLVFGIVAVRMGLTMRMPASGRARARGWVQGLRRTAPMSMGASVILMAAVVIV